MIAAGAAVEPVRAATPDAVICADGGVGVALAAARRIDRVVGDFDSATERELAEALAAGAQVDRHPIDKDESDLELALAAAVADGATEISVHLADGGRLDHQLANLVVLTSDRWRDARIDGWVGNSRVWVVRDSLVVPLGIGDPVAIQAVGGSAIVSTSGLAFALTSDALHPAEARGIANRVVSIPATVAVGEGVVLVLSTPNQPAQAT